MPPPDQPLIPQPPSPPIPNIFSPPSLSLSSTSPSSSSSSSASSSLSSSSSVDYSNQWAAYYYSSSHLSPSNVNYPSAYYPAGSSTTANSYQHLYPSTAYTQNFVTSPYPAMPYLAGQPTTAALGQNFAGYVQPAAGLQNVPYYSPYYNTYVSTTAPKN